MKKLLSLIFLTCSIFLIGQDNTVQDASCLSKCVIIANDECPQDQSQDNQEVFRRKKCCCNPCANESCSNFTVKGVLTVNASVINLGPVRILSGSGAPTISAPQGSLYLRTDGSGTDNRAYINIDGLTGWTAISTIP